MPLRIVGLAGPPGSGKSTLARSLIARLPPGRGESRILPTPAGNPCLLLFTVHPRPDGRPGGVIVMGAYPPDEPCPGTDRLDMKAAAVFPDFVRSSLTADRLVPAEWALFFEGRRLMTRRIVEQLVRLRPSGVLPGLDGPRAGWPGGGLSCRFFVLDEPDDLLRARLDVQGRRQSDRFRKGAATQARGLLAIEGGGVEALPAAGALEAIWEALGLAADPGAAP